MAVGLATQRRGHAGIRTDAVGQNDWSVMVEGEEPRRTHGLRKLRRAYGSGGATRSRDRLDADEVRVRLLDWLRLQSAVSDRQAQSRLLFGQSVREATERYLIRTLTAVTSATPRERPHPRP